MNMEKKDLGLYIHIPFCESKCYYCDFNSHVNKNYLVEKYIMYLKKELDLYINDLKGYNLKTIFFGGGTPSAIDEKYIYDILNHLYKNTDISHLKEITLEANPKTLNTEKLKVYKSLGINRISLGVQTLNDSLLTQIGRIHTTRDFLDTYELIRSQGFENINTDIMFNLPNQTYKDVIKTLKEIIKLDIKHISYYSLKIEEGTPFHVKYEKDELRLPEEDVERKMYHGAIELLEKNGYKQYEISNFAKQGYECNHNIIYWKVKPYIGVGLSAHSNINSYRYGNTEKFEEYFKMIDENKLPIYEEEKEFIDKDMEIAEYIILGLRLIDGINKEYFSKRFGITIRDVLGKKLDKFIEEGLLEENDYNVKLTKKGLDLCNIVFMEVLP